MQDRMRSARSGAILIATALLALSTHATAAIKVAVSQTGAHQTAVSLEGNIEDGDSDKFVDALTGVKTDTAVKLSLNSLGGKVREARRMAVVIRNRKFAVEVKTGSTCASACFLLFAAGVSREAGRYALIGVHSVSVDGQETPETMAGTTALARIASSYGVPPGILGKLVTTKPGQITWLQADDLAQMGVQIDDQRLGSKNAGRQTASDEAEYRGVYLCGQGLTALSLRIPAVTSRGQKDATFSFEADPRNPGVPSGSFSMQGDVDLTAGVMELHPVAWIQQPGRWRMIGLSGASQDGGRSFRGEITGGLRCSKFSMARVR